MDARASLIGRGAELRVLAAARAAGEVGVVLTGAAGVGKSRLARAALEEARAAGAATVWIQATSSAAEIPFGAFAGAVPLDVRSDDPLTLLRGSAQALIDGAGRRALVLAVDDAQLLDERSAALVLHLAQASAVFVVLTVRTGAPCPDAIAALWKDAGARRLELGALSEADTGALAEAVLGGPAEEGVRQWAWALGAGNALYVSELLHGALGDGSLERAGGLWRMRRRPRVAASLADLVGERLNDLPAGERAALELLALGEPLPLSVADPHVSADALVAVEDQGLVTVDDGRDDPLLRLTHPIYGEAIRAGLPTLRAREIRLALAGTLGRREPLGPEEALRVARWLYEAREPIPAGLLTDAARAAIRTGDPELGATLAARAGPGIEASLLLARAHTAANRFAEAATVLAAAEPRIETREQAMTYLEQQAAVLNWGLSRPHELRALLERAGGWWDDEAWQRRLEPLRVGIEAHLSPDGPGGDVARSSELLSAGTPDPQRRRELEIAHLRALSHAGRGREAARLARALVPRRPSQDLWDESALVMWVGVSAETGEGWGELRRWCEATLPGAVRREDHGAAGAAALGLAHLAYCAGRYRDADRWLAEAQLHYEQHDLLGLLAIVSANQAGVAAALGDTPAVLAARDRCLAAVRGDPPPRNQRPFRRLADAWAAQAVGEAAQAQAMLLAGADELAPTPLYAVRLAYEALRQGAPAGEVAPRLAELDARSDASLPAAEAAHAAGLAAEDGDALLAAAERLADIGALRYGAEAAADAARAYLAAGRQPEARRAAARSRGLCVPDQGAQPLEIPGLSESVALSERERQLAELAAAGRTNAEIAERLVLSVRTVESHIYRAMQKLGVGDRRELGRFTDQLR